MPIISQIADDSSVLSVGSNVSLSDLIEEFKKRSAESEVFLVMAKHIEKVANVPVRNVSAYINC